MSRGGLVKEVRGLAAAQTGTMTMTELLDLRRKLSSALAQVDAMVAARPVARDPVDRIGNFAIDGAARRVLVDDEEIRLPRIEYELLSCLVVNVGRLVTMDELITRIWPGPIVPANTNGALKVHIRWLREKLADRAPFRIVNVRGAGYRLDPVNGAAPLSATSPGS